MRPPPDRRSDRPTRLRGALVFGLVWLAGTATWAQEWEPPAPRQGYYLSAGLYNAATLTRERGQSLGPWVGLAGALRVGQIITEHFGLGLSFEGGRSYGQGQTATITAFSLESSWFFARHWAARAGVGVGFLHLQNPSVINEPSTRGPAGSWCSAGASYEWFLSPPRGSGGLSLSPTVQARFVPGNGTTGMSVYLGVEGTFWTGLPREQLALPVTGAGR